MLRPAGIALVTPFLVPVHRGEAYGDFWRWSPQGLGVFLRSCGFEPDVRHWGNLAAAKAILENLYLRADEAWTAGLSLTATECEEEFPVTVWAIATKPAAPSEPRSYVSP